MAQRWTILVFGLLVSISSAGERVPWTTSRVIGTPEPPLPFWTERVFPKLSFEKITLLAMEPGIDRMLVGEQAGKIWSFRMRGDVETKDLVVDLKAAIKDADGRTIDALYGMAFDPQFAENRYVYLCYVQRGRGAVLEDGSRVSRFRMTTNDPPTIDPQSETVILTFRSAGHNGGCLEFGPDGYLYVTTGDAAGPSPPDELKTGQDCSDLLSSILRIDVHRRDGERNYAIPADNPFVNLPNVRPEIWAYGLRNPWKMTFDRETGELWVADVGWDLWEMVHWVTKGANFGWSAYEGSQPIRSDVALGPTPIIPPLIALPHTISASVTGGYVYRGAMFPELRGEYIFGDWETKRVWAARRQPTGEGVYRDLADSELQIAAFGQDHAGELYLADYSQGVIHTLVRNEMAGQPSSFPRKLSETGLFVDVAAQIPAAGVLPFEINQPQWSDFATARRWIAMPGTDPITWHPADVEIPGSMFKRQHDYPAGTVLVKTLSLEMRRGDPQSARPLETQLLHFDGLNWRGYSYAWNDAQTDAELVPGEGREVTLTVDDPQWAGGRRVQRWNFAGRLQCLSCHSPWAQYALAFNPAQLNRTIDRDGETISQLAWLESHGVYSRVDRNRQPLSPLTTDALAKLPKLARHDDATASAAEHARSYLHVNCAHCHQFNGGGAGSFELLLKHADKNLKVIDEVPKQGTFDIPEARLIAPGEPARSVLYLRMAKFGRGRMPHRGSEFVDEQALAWMEAWINGLGETPPKPDVLPLAAALSTARKLGRGELAPSDRDIVLAAAMTNSSSIMQDLLAGYQPPERQRHTLGNAIRPDTILAQTGNATRGEQLFWTTAGMQCKLCHKVGPRGGDIGPELTEVVKKRTRLELIESLVEPSKLIDVKFATFVAETTQGRVHSGLIVRQDDREVVLRDSQGRDTVLARRDIEELSRSPKSLMPDQLLRDLTADEAADLLAYLTSLADVGRK
jgi:putative heme-binding domain-containing protein